MFSIASIKRHFLRPLSKTRSAAIVTSKTLSPIQILEQEKKYHTNMLAANKAGKRDLELEFKHKRDALRLIMGIYE